MQENKFTYPKAKILGEQKIQNPKEVFLIKNELFEKSTFHMEREKLMKASCF